MYIIVEQPTIIGGRTFEVSPVPQYVEDNIAEHLISIGNAKAYQTKVVTPEKKTHLSASQPDPVSQKKTATRRRKAKPK